MIALLVVLAGAFGAAGYFGAVKIIDAQGSSTPTTPGPSPKATPTITVDSNDPGTFCPKVTADAIKAAGRPGALTLLFYFEGTGPNGGGAEAWICRDSNGSHYYQGHRKTGPFTAATSSDSLLLGAGIQGSVEAEPGGYVALNPSGGKNTEYHVSSTKLVLVEPTGAQTTYTPTRVVAPQ
jgi:hypothetical protein